MFVAIGRLFDLVDGWLANRTGTKSALGEAMDASVDKLTLLPVIIFLPLGAVIDWWLAVSLLAVNLVIAVISLAARIRQYRLHPSRFGKYATAVTWLALVILVAGRAADIGAVYAGGWALLLSAIAMTLVAAVQYSREYNTKAKLAAASIQLDNRRN
jgi:phosphatidylglycerophosphate synthase